MNDRHSEPHATEHPVETALRIALDAHRGQEDKAGRPYILHPLRVALAQSTDAAFCAALLHDAVEDTPLTLDDLRSAGVSETVVAAVDALTRREGESYNAYLARAGADPIAISVKRADLQDNLDVRRLRKVTDTDARRLTKYLGALSRLSDAD